MFGWFKRKKKLYIVFDYGYKQFKRPVLDNGEHGFVRVFSDVYYIMNGDGTFRNVKKKYYTLNYTEKQND